MKITLQSKPNSFLINDREFQKGYIDVNYRVDGTIGFGNTIKGTLDEITADGQVFGTIDELKTWISANLFKSGGSDGGNGVSNGVQSVTGNMVDNTDPKNPKVNRYVETIGYLNLSDGSNFSMFSSVDVSKILSSSSPNGLGVINIQFPKLDNAIYKRVLIFAVDVDLINQNKGSGVTVNNVPTKAKKGDCWTIVYDKNDFTWDLVAINSMPKWYIDEAAGDGIAGTNRQVQGFVDGKVQPVTLGWKQFSDLPSVPPFKNGVLTGTAFDEDGNALFAFIELATEGFKQAAIPLYKSNGRMSVGRATEDDDAIQLGQINGYFMAIQGYIEGASQTLTHVNGKLKWV